MTRHRKIGIGLIKFLFTLFILSSWLTHFAQDRTEVESLVRNWKSHKHNDSSELILLYNISWKGFLFNQPDSAFYYAQLHYQLAETLNDTAEMALALNTQGASYWVRSEFALAMHYFRRGLELRLKLGNKKEIADSYNNIGLIYERLGDHPMALDYHNKSLKLREELQDQKGIAMSLNNIGIIYEKRSEPKKALEYYKNSLETYKLLKDQNGTAASLMNIGLIHHGQGSYLQALDYFEKSLNLFQTLEDLSSTAAAYHNMAMTNESLGEFLKADEFLAESIRIRTELTDKLGLSSSYIQLGLNQLRQGKSEAAIQKCLKALKLSEEAMALTEQKESCNCLYLAYKQNGEQTLALQFHERMSVLDDSLQTDKTGRKLQQMEFQRQILMDSIKGAEERLKLELEYEKQVHRESSRRNIAILAGLFFLVSTIGLYSRVKYIRKSRSALQFEKERSEKLLLNILPAQIADELKERGEARAKNFAEVSILFTDFKDFTGKAANLSPEDLVEEINICFKVFDSICEKFGIEKIKTIGDAYMAGGGLPVPFEESARVTVLAALEMAEFIKKRSQDQLRAGKISFEMRAGVHTGPVVAGIVGAKKFQYDVWGDTVNTASRMESSGEAGKVNISKATYVKIKEDPQFRFLQRGRIEAKGKGFIPMYFVESILPKAES